MEKEGVFWRVLDSSKDAIIITDLKIPMKVSFWNKKAEETFGYKRSEVLGKINPALPEEHKLEMQSVRKEIIKGNEMLYKSKRRTKEGKLIDVLVKSHPFRRNDKISGIITSITPLTEIKDAQDMTATIRKRQQIRKRSFFQIREKLLLELLKGEHTINELSVKTGINWRTVESHLVYLVGRGLIKEVFSSEYVRIFRISDFGRSYILGKGNHKMNGYMRLNKNTIKIQK